MPTQHIETLLGEKCCVPLATLLRCVATCWVLLAQMKPRPNDSNITTQHNPTLLAQYLQAPAKRSQHLNATDRNIVERNMMHAFGHPVTSWKSNYYAWSHAILLHEPGQTTTASCNIHKCYIENLTIFKFEPATPNMLQQVATGRPNALNMLHPTMLRYVALKCCDRLAGAWQWSNLSQQHPTCCNTSQRGDQTHSTRCAQQCCDMLRPTMLRYVALACCDRLPRALENKVWWKLLDSLS